MKPIDKIAFFGQKIDCTWEGSCMGIEVLTRVGEDRKSIQDILDNSSKQQKIDIDKQILNELHAKIVRGYFLNTEININIHQSSIVKTEVCELLLKIIKLMTHDKLFKDLYVEILENGDKDQNNEFSNILNNKIGYLQSFGIKVGIDDYPMGNTGSLIKKITKLDFVKIDKQFLLKETKENLIEKINNLIIEIKKYHSNAKIVIEGVEEGIYKDLLIELGVDAFQGYYIGKPYEIIG